MYQVQFTALTENCPINETGNYETNVGDHYGYSSYHQNVYWSSVAKNSELQIVLKTDDYRITIDYLRTRPVDLIIMDIDLPGTDGFTFLKRIKQIQSTVKVLFLSSKSECFYAGRAIQAGANGFVSKCNDQNDIFHAVQMILSGYTFFPAKRSTI